MLNQTTAMAEKAVQTIRNVVTFEVVALAKFAALEEGEDPREVEAICSDEGVSIRYEKWRCWDGGKEDRGTYPTHMRQSLFTRSYVAIEGSRIRCIVFP